MYKVKLYGTNTATALDSNKMVTKTDVTATTHGTVEFNCYFIRPHKEHQGEEMEFAGGVRDVTSINRRKYDIETEYLTQANYNTLEEAITGLQTYRYKYLEITDYLDTITKYVPSGKLIPIFISSKSYGEEGSFKNLSLVIYAKYAQGAQ